VASLYRRHYRYSEGGDAPERALAQLVWSVLAGWDLPREKRYLACAPISHDLLDALPLTPVGKPDKKLLRARYWTGHARRVN
jgi:acyl-CoA synthetase (AMP-forming)/AMP-acid ligase II